MCVAREISGASGRGTQRAMRLRTGHGHALNCAAPLPELNENRV